MDTEESKGGKGAEGVVSNEYSDTNELNMPQNSFDSDGWVDLVQNLADKRALLEEQELAVADKNAIIKLVNIYRFVKKEEPLLRAASLELYEVLIEQQLLYNSQPPITVFFNMEPFYPRADFYETVKLLTKGTFQWCATTFDTIPTLPTNLDAKKWLTVSRLNLPVDDIVKHVHQFFPTGVALYTSNDAYVTDVELFEQIYLALLTLADGGHLVIRQHIFSTPYRRSLLALIAYFFQETSVVKPLASNPVLSDVFVVGRNFLKSRLTETVMAQLQELALNIQATMSTTTSIIEPILETESYLETDDLLLNAAKLLYVQQQVLYMTLGVTLFKMDAEKNNTISEEYLEKQAKYWLSRYYKS